MSATAPPATNPTPADFDAPDPRNRASDKKTADRALNHVLEAFRVASNARGQLPDKWAAAYRAWRGKRNRRAYMGRANIVDPEPSRTVETLASRISEAVFASPPILRAIPREKTGHEREQAEIAEGLVQFQMDAIRAEPTIRSWIKSTILYGTGILRVWWDRDFRKRPKRRKAPVRGEFGLSVEPPTMPEETLMYEGPHLRLVDIENFYVPSVFCEDIQKQDYVIEEREVPYRQLWSMAKKGTVLKAAVDRLKANRERSGPQNYGQRLGNDYVRSERLSAADINEDSLWSEKPALRKCNVLCYEGAFDIDDDGIEEECWIWVADEKEVLLAIENPYWHGKKSYVKAQFIRAPNEFYGVNYFEWIEDLWYEQCDRHNQALDSVNFAMNPVMFAGKAAGLNQTQLLRSPGKVVDVNDINQLKWDVPPDMSDACYKSIAVISRSIRETTGATDLLQGGGGGIDKATVYAGMVNEAQMRIRDNLRNVFDALVDLGDSWYALNGQYMDTEQAVRILGKDGFDFVPIRPEDLDVPMDFRAVGTGALSTLLQKNFAMMQFMQAFTPLMVQGLVKFDAQEVMKRFWSDALGYQDGDQIFGDKGLKPMDPRQETILIRKRQPVDVHPQEDFPAHLREHLMMKQAYETGQIPMDPIAYEKLGQHIQETQAMFQRVERAKQAMAAMQRQALENQVAAMGPRTNGNGGQGGSPPGIAGSANMQNLGGDMGAPKSMGEALAGGG